MKVHETHRQVLQQSSKGNQRNGAQEKGDFRKIMDQMTHRMDESEETTRRGDPVTLSGGVQIIDQARVADGPLAQEETRWIVSELERSLSLLDFYAARLGDTSLSISGMDLLVENLEENMEGLQALDGRADLPEGLRPILSEVVVTMGTEIARFKRGDFGV